MVSVSEAIFYLILIVLFLFQAPCYQGGGYGTLCIEDPYDVNNDVGKSSYGFPNCKKTFEQAYFHFLKQFEPKPPQCNLR